jgi:hypothetical protein
MSRPLTAPADLAQLQAEMRQIFPRQQGSVGQTYRDVRALNQARFDAAMRARQRPTRVS